MKKGKLSDDECKEIDFCLMLDGHNLTKFRQDICSHHHHLWHARITYLLGKPESLSVIKYFNPDYEECECILCRKEVIA